MPLDEQKLKTETEIYWLQPRIEGYITTHVPGLGNLSLLQAEIKYAQTRGSITANGPVTTLVLLVGYSFEPLLQSICTYKPANLVLVLNETYGDTPGADFGDKFQQWIRLLPRVKLIDKVPRICQYTARDDPAAIFQVMLDAIREYPNGTIVIDITGGKKSMATGAFLFAAFSGYPISYVDFDEYNIERGRPYGYTCRIGTLSNPYDSFVLREWHDLIRHYKNYQFQAAKQQLKKIKTQLQTLLLGSFARQWKDPIDKLDGILECYEFWDNGDHRRAKEVWQNRLATVFGTGRFTPPSAVEVLGDAWPQATSTDPSDMAKELINQYIALELGTSTLRCSFYGHRKAFLTYAHDERERICRLIRFKEDFRSALLRAAALHEILVKARFFCLLQSNNLTLETLPGKRQTAIQTAPIAGQPDQVIKEIIKKLTGYVDIGALKRSLRWNDTRSDVEKIKYRWEVELGDPPTWHALHRTDAKDVPILEKYWETQGLELKDGQLSELRNKAIHTAFAIPKDLAEAALHWIMEDITEFEHNWVQPLTALVLAESWSEACRLTGLDKVLPPSLLR